MLMSTVNTHCGPIMSRQSFCCGYIPLLEVDPKRPCDIRILLFTLPGILARQRRAAWGEGMGWGGGGVEGHDICCV